MVQRREGALKPLPDSTQEEKENKEIGLMHALNSGDTRFIAAGPPRSPFPLQATPKIELKEAMAPPQYDEGWVSPSKNCQGTQLVQGASLSQARHFPLRQYPTGGVTQEGQPTGYLLLGPYSILHFRLAELEEFQPLVWGGSSENGRSYSLHFCHSSFKLDRCTGSP